MIKVVAFDFVGVLVNEKDIELTEVEDKLERMYGANINDLEYLFNAKEYFNNDSILIKTTEDIINKIYKIRDSEIFIKLKTKYKNVKLIIATNHVSYVRSYIEKTFGAEYLDDIIISAEIHKIKPNENFYVHILEKYDLKPNELLFLDDNIKNIDGANKLGINTIIVTKDTNLYEKVSDFIG